MKKILLITLFVVSVYADNQTPDTTPVLLNQAVPFTVSIEKENFMLPAGIQSAPSAQHKNLYLFLAGRTNGLHDFSGDIPNNNFPPSRQNSTIFVIDPDKKKVYTRSLYDPFSGLTQQQIDSLSVTSPQYCQSCNTLYITGGYGVDTSTGLFSTKDTLTAINVPGLIRWVTHPRSSGRAKQYIRQTSHPIFQVTGGAMHQVGSAPTLLMLGQNFSGYYTPTSNGDYTNQIRRFHILDNGVSLDFKLLDSTEPDPNYRRRDLNIVPFIRVKNFQKIAEYVALSGVFVPSFGIWTVPIEITTQGQPSMADPNLPATFKQGMNIYNSAHAELLSQAGDMYSILFGGITFESFQAGQFLTHPGFPFTNQVSVVKRDVNGVYSQYLLSTQMPRIVSTNANPGNPLLFGAGARFMPTEKIHRYANGVLDLAKIKKPKVIGYIIGGIQSTLPETNSSADSSASPYIFKVILTPK